MSTHCWWGSRFHPLVDGRFFIPVLAKYSNNSKVQGKIAKCMNNFFLHFATIPPQSHSHLFLYFANIRPDHALPHLPKILTNCHCIVIAVLLALPLYFRRPWMKTPRPIASTTPTPPSPTQMLPPTTPTACCPSMPTLHQPHRP